MFVLLSNITDEDECADADLNTCDQQCNNNVGGFICGCRDGFTVNVNDDTKCTGNEWNKICVLYTLFVCGTLICIIPSSFCQSVHNRAVSWYRCWLSVGSDVGCQLLAMLTVKPEMVSSNTSLVHIVSDV